MDILYTKMDCLYIMDILDSMDYDTTFTITI